MNLKRSFAALLFIANVTIALPASAQGVTTLQLATLSNIGGMSISPNGKYVVYQVYQGNPQTNSYSNQWMLADTSTRRSRVLIANGGDPVLAYEDNTEVTDYRDDWASFNPVWASDDIFYYVRKDRGIITVHRFDLNGSDTLLSGYSGNVFSFHRVDGRRATFTTWSSNAKTVAVSKDQLKNGWLYFDGPRDMNIAVGPPDMTPEKVPHYYGLDLASGSIRPVAKSLETGGTDPDTVNTVHGLLMMYLTPSPNGKARAFVGIQTLAPLLSSGLYLLPAKAAGPSEIVPLQLNDAPDGLQWSADSRYVYYVAQSKSVNSDIFRVDAGTKRIQRLTNASAYLYDCSYNVQVTLATCAMETSTHPANIAVVNMSTGKITAVTDLNAEFDRRVAGIRTQTLTWKNKWGDTLFGTLTYPRNYTPGKRYPLVFLTYWDQGFQRGGSGDEFPIFPLAEHGFFVLNTDVENAGPRHDATKHPPGTVNFRNWEGPLDGMERIGKKFIAQGMVQPGFGIGGLSYGSELAVYAPSHSTMFTAASESHGGSFRDPFDYYFKGHSWDGTFREWGLGGPPYGNAYKFWKLLSPALNADRTKAAILMNSNDQEYVPGLQQFWEMRDRNKPVEFWIFHDEEHTKHQPVHRLVIYNRNVDWYSFWLQGKVDPDPSKRAQYKRWERLKALQK